MIDFDIFFTNDLLHVQTSTHQFQIDRTGIEHLDTVAYFINQLLNGESTAPWPGQVTTERIFFRVTMARKRQYDWFNGEEVNDVFNLMNHHERVEWTKRLTCNVQQQLFTTLFALREQDEVPTFMMAV